MSGNSRYVLDEDELVDGRVDDIEGQEGQSYLPLLRQIRQTLRE